MTRIPLGSVIHALLIGALVAAASFGCGYSVLSSRTETQARNLRILGYNETYGVSGMALRGESLVVSLDRACHSSQEVDQDTLLVETRERELSLMWLGLLGVGAVGGSTSMIVGFGASTDEDFAQDGLCFTDVADCEAQNARDVEDAQARQDTAATVGWVTLGVVAAGAALILILDGGQYESETLLARDTVRQEMVEVRCEGLWPSGGGTALATSLGVEFPAYGDGSGRVEIDVRDAPFELWADNSRLRLEIPGLLEWLEFAISGDAVAAALGGMTQSPVTISLTFDDGDGDADGVLDAGELAELTYEIVNHGVDIIEDVRLDIQVQDARGLDVDSPVRIGNLEPGQAVRGQLQLGTSIETSSQSVIFAAELTSTAGLIGQDRIAVNVDTTRGPTRAYVWAESSDDDFNGLLQTGSVQLQTVLTNTGGFVFVADSGTRVRIDNIVDHGGGSVEDRLRSAIDAANQENIRRVFQLDVNPVAGEHVQLVLAVYDTGSTDRIYLTNSTVDSGDALAVLDGFDQLAQAFIVWDQRQ